MPMTDEVFELLMHRMDSQDRILQDIHGEVKRTNGRVTALEQQRAISADREVRQVRSGDTRRWHYGILIAVLSAIVGGGMGNLLHLVGA